MSKRAPLCVNCLNENPGLARCPNCGYEAGRSHGAEVSLPPGTILEDKYLIGRVLGQGGFGITYLALDKNLDTRVAIKEYFPGQFATRAIDQLSVSPFGGYAGERYGYGLEKFLDEARALARFVDHHGIASVKDFFKMNNTAYMVMSYVEGVTLKKYLEMYGGKIPYLHIIKLMMPVMETLSRLHEIGLLHRDISPDNIYITTSGVVKLLDFGAARYAMTEQIKSLSVILKPGYAPEEQYRSKGNQGPWTDVYAVCATIYHAITGLLPPESLDRIELDTLKPPSEYGIEIPIEAEESIMKGLNVRARDRIASIRELSERLRPEDPDALITMELKPVDVSDLKTVVMGTSSMDVICKTCGHTNTIRDEITPLEDVQCIRCSNLVTKTVPVHKTFWLSSRVFGNAAAITMVIIMAIIARNIPSHEESIKIRKVVIPLGRLVRPEVVKSETVIKAVEDTLIKDEERQASERMKVMREEVRAYKEAIEVNTVDSWNGFLVKYPRGQYKAKALSALKRLQQEEAKPVANETGREKRCGEIILKISEGKIPTQEEDSFFKNSCK